MRYAYCVAVAAIKFDERTTMKLNRKTLVLALAAAVAACSMPVFAQDEGVATDTDSTQTSSKLRFQKEDRIIAQMLKDPESAPESLREQVATLRESQQLIRSAWIENFHPGEDATAEEIKAAREAFQAEFAVEIRASKDLRFSVMRELRSGVRDAIDDSTWNRHARAIYAEYMRTQSELSGAWREIRKELGEGATREEIAAAKERFNEENSDLLLQQKELALQVRELIRDNRQERGAARDELPQELQDLRSDMSDMRDQVRSRQRQARDDMRNLGREEREQYRRTLLEDLKELHDEIKERRRQVIDEIRDGQNGDRRPEG